MNKNGFKNNILEERETKVIYLLVHYNGSLNGKV